MKFLLFVLIFLVVSGLIIVHNNNLQISNSEDFKEFKILYSGWIEQIYENSQMITGSVVKMNWLPK